MEEIQISMQEGSGRQRKAVIRLKMTFYNYYSVMEIVDFVLKYGPGSVPGSEPTPTNNLE